MGTFEILLGLFAIGVLTGLRAMTPIAVLCWMKFLGRLPANHCWMDFVANKISVGVFTLGAIGELIGDKLPKTPSRTRLPGLGARIVFGGLCAAILAATSALSVPHPVMIGAVVGAIGGAAGAYGGWFVRTRSVSALRCPDLPIALIEDAIAIGGSYLICMLFAQ
jgi:uncharacterized membrane protein